ncbi:MAG: chemotaxis protein CheD [Proteobacteria bacterium]|nr:chemotaxis protein CheD [Pseudomonadota bacterium]
MLGEIVMKEDAHPHRVEVFLQPGEFYVGDATHRIRTLLGSCVSITIWHPRLRVGAMSHFLLPTRGRTKASPPDGRYGDEALWLMLQALAMRGVRQTECQAKIFGGGNMFPHHAPLDQTNVGTKNGLTARLLLTACGIPVVSESLFGVGHRNIIFDISNGHVWSRQINPPDSIKKTPQKKGLE